ncbi:hypothetical protein B0O99DRAFT_629867, partial [Bisporella sp. PMI_857]
MRTHIHTHTLSLSLSQTFTLFLYPALFPSTGSRPTSQLPTLFFALSYCGPKAEGDRPCNTQPVRHSQTFIGPAAGCGHGGSP